MTVTSNRPAVFEFDHARQLQARDWWLALGVGLLAVLIRLPSATKGFWIDEYYSLRDSSLPLADLFERCLTSGHMPLFFLYSKLSIMFGTDELILRTGSLAAFFLTILLLTGLAGALGLRRYLPTFWAFAAFNPYWVTISTEFRYMMLLVALNTGVAWASVVYIRRGGLLPGTLVGVLCLMMLLTLPTGLFTVLAIGLFIFWQRLKPGNQILWPDLWRCLPVLAPLVIMAPVFWILRHVSLIQAPALPSLDTLVHNLLQVAFGRTYLLPEAISRSLFSFNQYIVPTVAMVTLVVAIGLTYRALNGTVQGRMLSRLLVSLFFVMPALFLFFSATFCRLDGPARYWAPLSLPVVFFAVIAWHAPVRPFYLRMARGLIVLIWGFQFFATLTDRGDLQREAAQWIIDNHRGNEKIFVARDYDYFQCFQYLHFDPMDCLEVFPTIKRNEANCRRYLTANIESLDRFFVMFYRPRLQGRSNMEDVLEKMEDRDLIAGFRGGSLNELTAVFAVARNVDQLDWLKSLSPLERPWGTSRGDY